MTDNENLPKYVTIKLSDGSVWGLPVSLIVENYAKLVEKVMPYEKSIELANDFFENHQNHLLAWITSMKWSHFQGQEIKIADAKIDYDQELRTSKEKGFFG